jgi:hypothetical protein
MNGGPKATETPRELRLSAAALVLANLVPLAGVLLWQWSVSSVVILYWFENVVIGAINVLRIIMLSPADGPLGPLATAVAAGDQTRAAVLSQILGQLGDTRVLHGLKLFIVPFFIIHYFGFCAGHGVFVFSMFGDGDGYFTALPGFDLVGVLGRAIEIFSTPLAMAAAALVLSHVFSFVQNYVFGGEFRRLDLRRLMIMPYGRIVALHIAILVGGFTTMMLGEPVWLVVILVAGKIAVDLKMHLAEHAKAR